MYFNSGTARVRLDLLCSQPGRRTQNEGLLAGTRIDVRFCTELQSLGCSFQRLAFSVAILYISGQKPNPSFGRLWQLMYCPPFSRYFARGCPGGFTSREWRFSSARSYRTWLFLPYFLVAVAWIAKEFNDEQHNVMGFVF